MCFLLTRELGFIQRYSTGSYRIHPPPNVYHHNLRSFLIMTTNGFCVASVSPDADLTDTASVRRGQALSNKLNSVLSSSYADSEIREALRLYDLRYAANKDIELDLRYESQREVIEANARIVNDFSKVVKVSCVRVLFHLPCTC